MNKLYSIIWLLFILKENVFARLRWWNNELNSALQPPTTVKQTAETTDSWFFSWFLDSIYSILHIILYIFIAYILFIIFLKLIRVLYEVIYFKNLVYLKVTLPRNDSKLDKEHETKKDFKEKIWMMSMFYKSSHKLSDVWFVDSIINFIFKNAKLSLELVYDKWEVSFFIVTYKNYLNLINQQVTSIYTDAEVKIIDPNKEYINLKEPWYSLRW